MDQNVVNNVASHCAYEYGLTDRLDELKELIKNHGNKPFYIFWYMSFVKKIFNSFKKGNVYHWVSQPKGITPFRGIKKKCYIQVKKRRVVEEPFNSEYLKEIYFTVNVFR